jgi:cytochrome P450
MAIVYEPFADSILADPYPWYRWLRREAPCYYSDERDTFIVSRYDDVLGVLRHPEVFSSHDGIGWERRHTRDLVSADPPEHTRLRRIVNREFLPRAIGALEPRINEIVDSLVDDVLERGAADLVRDLAEPLPLLVIAELLGIPFERRDDFKRWSDDLIDTVSAQYDDAEAARLKASRKELGAFFREIAADRRGRAGGVDLISRLVAAQEADALGELELVEFCIVLLVAGNETTTNAVGNGALAVLTYPDQWRAVVADPSLVPSFVEEVLRFDAPVQGFCRTALTDVEVAGTSIPRGGRVLALFGSANRDGRHFPDGDTFLAARNPVDHVAFGNGIHLCLGAPLARLELTALAAAFRARVRSILPAGEIVRTQLPLFRGVRRLPVLVEPA